MVVTRSQTQLIVSSTNAETTQDSSSAQAQGNHASEIATTSHQVGSVTADPMPAPAPTRSTSSRSSRSSATVTARKLAAEAQHARHLARAELAAQEAQMKAALAAKKLELERNTAELDAQEAQMKAALAAKKLELERSTADLTYQAKLAAIDAQSDGTISGRDRGSIKQWLQSTGSGSVVMPEIRNDTFDLLPNNQPDSTTGLVHDNPQLGPTNTVNYLQAPSPYYNDVATAPPLGADRPTPTSSVSSRSRDVCEVADVATPDAGRRRQQQDGANNISQLVNVFQSLVDKVQPNSKPKGRCINLPTFDGKSPIDWLVFKRTFYNSDKCFTATENLARLSAALSGTARDAVCMLLATAVDPNIVMQELDRRFGRPEQIVLREVESIRALPKVNNDLKDLTIFASRVRNCVEVVKLLNKTDYLRSPELFGALINKFHPLLRTRWLDYAAARAAVDAPCSSARVELLSDFLSREVDLHVRFDTPVEISHLPRDRAHAVSESKPGPRKESNSGHSKNIKNNTDKNPCALCKQCHDLSTCDKFKAMTIDDRWHFIKENKVCYRCLQKGSHSFRLCNKNKNKCEIDNCNRKHHTLLHNPNFISATSAHAISAPTSPTTSSPTTTSSNAEQNVVREVTAHTTAKPARLSVSNVSATPRPLLKIVAVTVSGPAGSVDTFALLDDGSSSTFIDSDISSRIGAVGPEGQIHLDCVGGLSRETSVQYVDFEIKGRHSSQSFSIHRARSIKNLGITCNQSVIPDDLLRYPYLSNLSDELCYDNASPTLVIGIDNWHLSVAATTRRGTKSQPVAIQTALGWVLFGFTSSITKSVDSLYHVVISTETESPRSELEELIKAQYKLDAIGITKHEARSNDDQRALDILGRTARRLPSGRFEVGLLWKSDNMTAPDSYPLALSRYKSLEKKMLREPEYAERYRKNIRDTLDKGYAEECTVVKPTGVCWYLPHFGVINPNKPAKLRVVHDAAARSSGVSLNSMLLTGPDLLQSQLGILMRFREGRIALTADIKEMFPQVKILQQDRDAQRFLWRDDPSGPIKIFRMSSMIFGACSSPSTAIYITNLNASEFREEFPKTVEIIKSNTYMDDFICSVDSTDNAARLAAEVVTIHQRGGFEMRGWTTNDPAAVASLPNELLSSVIHTKTCDVDLCKDSVARTLGLIWQPLYDKLAFNSGLSNESWAPVTKRQALTQVMRVYDPLGILAPIVIRGRILFQNLWRKGLEWDERLSEDDCKVWHEWFESLKSISELRIPRWYNQSPMEVIERELHVFCDASESAHATVAYWRLIDVTGHVRLVLIASKVRVAPLKPASIPRLELQGALIATRLASFIVESHRCKPIRRYFWCDSMTVLGWLRSDARNYKPFVANRVGEILENSVISEWRWVPTLLNVADDATRIKCSSLSSESRWITGPEFLLSTPSNWPSEPVSSVTDKPLDQTELKPSARTTKSPSARLKSSSTSSISNIACNYNSVNELPEPVVANPSHFSSWLRLVRATARAHQFIAACITRVRGVSHNFIVSQNNPGRRNNPAVVTSQTTLRPLNVQALEMAETHILRQSQRNTFDTELQCLLRGRPIPPKSRLVCLSPATNQDGLLYVQSRTVAVPDVQDCAVHPILLDGKDQAVRLLISHFHKKFAHANTETVINELRQQYWILGLRNAVRSIVHNCQLCKLLRGKPLQPLMGDLPQARLSHHQRPFTFVGVDYFGPLQIMVRRKQEKRWVALFTCLTSRAPHLEVVHSLSADAAIMCLRRFIARRGTPSQIFSDNGTAFVGANRQLRALYDDAVTDYASNSKIEWSFIPPSAPFMGGAWERLVKSVKTALKVTLRERTPSEEVLATLLAEAEALVNSRPLTHVSPDASDPEALTPMHFILGSSSGRPIPARLTDSDLCSRTGWRRALRLADHFWRRWVVEYLPTLAPRRVRGSSTVVVKVGDPVLIADGDLPRGTWPRGIICQTFPGRDGVTRVVDIRTAAGTLRRPLKKVVLL